MIYVLLVLLYNNFSLLFYCIYYMFSQNSLCTELQLGGDLSLQFLSLLFSWFFCQSGKQ